MEIDLIGHILTCSRGDRPQGPRNGLAARAAAAVIAVAGEYGTLSEIALALKAVVGLGTWDIPGLLAAPDAAAAVALALR